MIVYRELSSLERDLGIGAKTLYAVSNNISKHYRKAKLPKENGGYRNLSVPDEVLKVIQRRIADVLLMKLMSLAVKNGDEVVVAAEGPAEEAAIAELKKFFEENL